jgi:hypothetical protein
MGSARASMCLCIGFLIVTGMASGAEDAGDAGRTEIVLFDSGPVDATTGIKVTQYYVADDFTTSTAANATTISFELGDWNGNFPAVFDGLIRWWIHTDGGGTPGALLAQGTAYDVGYSVTTPPGGSVYTTCYHVSFNLGQQVGLAPSNLYWLVLNVNQGLVYDELYSWIKSDSGFNNPACFSDGTPGCTPTSMSVTFSVIASTEVTYLFADGFETGAVNIWSSTAP